MRLRIPELLEERGLTPYFLVQQTEGKISLSTAYRYVRQRGHLATFDGALCELLCDAFGVTLCELLERDQPRQVKKVKNRQ